MPTQRGAPDPEQPGDSRMTWHEWQLSHAGDISGRETFVNCFNRTGGKRLLAAHDADLPRIPTLRYRGVVGPDRVVPRSWRLSGRHIQTIRAPLVTSLPATRASTRRETDDLIWFVAALGITFLLGGLVAATLITH